MATPPGLAFRLPIPCQKGHQECDYKIYSAMKTPHDSTPPARLWDRGAAHVEQRVLVLQPIRTAKYADLRVFVASVGNTFAEARVVTKNFTDAGNTLETTAGALCWPSAKQMQTASAEELDRSTTWKERPLSPFQVPSGIQILCYGEHPDGGYGNACRVVPLEY